MPPLSHAEQRALRAPRPLSQPPAPPRLFSTLGACNALPDEVDPRILERFILAPPRR